MNPVIRPDSGDDDVGPVLKHKFKAVERETEHDETQATCDKLKGIEGVAIVFHRKDLDRIAIGTLYKRVLATIGSRTARKKLSMMTSRTNKQHSTKWQPCAAMYTVVCSLGLTLSATNIFGGRLGQEASIDSRRIRH
jgi:hypothetical protein